MKLRTTFVTAAVAAMSLSFGAAPTTAQSNRVIPLDAATLSGTGCIVLDANLVYHDDPNCKWHVQGQAASDGELLRLQYSDHGQLPANAPHPKTTLRLTRMQECACPPGTPLVETVTPSGQYKSACDFVAGDEPVYLPPDFDPTDPKGNSGK